MPDLRPKRITYDLKSIVEEFWENNAVYDTTDGTRVPHKGTIRGRITYEEPLKEILNAIVVYEPDVPDA